MSSLEANHAAFEELGTVAAGISIDSVPCKNAWAKSLGIEHTRLLSDFWPHGGLAGSMGVFLEKDGVSKRANIVLDGEGTIIFIKTYPIHELPDIEEVIRKLSEQV
jgi:peroxiredoxin